ncbi:hypothetical protein K458DRAFT_44847 [Lentithecium fluviatile CBS 122367]|uniref:Uncharacterized protein n=1 Tax=Lentithecium fluviatile CBS 122367 TaxID=1168545 RepID=A0A6G1IZE9_9PLEO|nr:hypothetical protein K458DRAFT_44847 [Lentithecium fluviatile CBS 122367]
MRRRGCWEPHPMGSWRNADVWARFRTAKDDGSLNASIALSGPIAYRTLTDHPQLPHVCTPHHLEHQPHTPPTAPTILLARSPPQNKYLTTPPITPSRPDTKKSDRTSTVQVRLCRPGEAPGPHVLHALVYSWARVLVC